MHNTKVQDIINFEPERQSYLQLSVWINLSSLSYLHGVSGIWESLNALGHQERHLAGADVADGVHEDLGAVVLPSFSRSWASPG